MQRLSLITQATTLLCHDKPSPSRCAEVMSEEVIGSKFNGFLWGDQQNVDS
jgi:hypothetical protein